MRTTGRFVTVAAGALAALALTGCGDQASPSAAAADPATGDRPVVAVVGEGRVEGTPDVMTISLGVETRGATAQAALADNATRATNLVTVLGDSGVAKADIQTSDLSVYPNFDRGGREIVGYTVNNTVTAKLRDLGEAGEVIDAAAFATGDAIRLHGVSFSIDDTSELVARARADAVERASEQARQLADAAGVELGALRSIDETGTRLPPPLYYDRYEAAADAASRMPIEPGSQELTVEVTLVFDLGGS
jgi:uncharacterized protein YggE